MESVRYKEYKEAHYAVWDWIAEQVKQAKSIGDRLLPVHRYKSLWLESAGYDRSKILHDCFACAVCAQNCNECPLKYVLDGCMDVWLDVVWAFSNNDYTTAYDWAIKIRDGWR